MSNYQFRVLATVAVIILTVVLLMLLPGCNTHKKFVKYAATHKVELAELCAENFKPETLTVAGKDTVIIRTDTLFTPGDSVRCPDVLEPSTGKIRTVYAQCPPGKTITRETFRVDTIYQVNTARVFELTAKLDRSDKELKEKTAQYNKWLAIGLVGMVIGVVLLFMLLRK